MQSSPNRNDDQDRRREFRQRDGGMLRLMGFYFVTFAVLVGVGQFWVQPLVERLVNLGAGLILLLIGVGTILVARRLNRSKE